MAESSNAASPTPSDGNAVIERAGEYVFDHRLHGGQGSMRMQWHFFTQSRLPVAVQTWELEPGSSEGMHEHDAEEQPIDELYLVLSGFARMHVDDGAYDLAEGDAVLAQAGTRHDLINLGESVLRVLVVWGEPGVADWSGFGSAQGARRVRQTRTRG